MIEAKVFRKQSAWVFIEDEEITEGMSEDEVDDLILNIAYDRYITTDWDTHDCEIIEKRIVEG